MSEIIDSNLPTSEILAQNPQNPSPNEILETIGVMEVSYWGFDEKPHVGQIAMAQSVISEVEAFFRHAQEMEFPIAKVIPTADRRYKWNDEKLMADNVSSGFNYRLIAGTEQPSAHALGLAFDINPVQNPYIRYGKNKKIIQPTGAIWDKNQPGTLHIEHPLVKLMEGFGWEWGGNWTPKSGRTDYQHFQKIKR